MTRRRKGTTEVQIDIVLGSAKGKRICRMETQLGLAVKNCQREEEETQALGSWMEEEN